MRLVYLGMSYAFLPIGLAVGYAMMVFCQFVVFTFAALIMRVLGRDLFAAHWTVLRGHTGSLVTIRPNRTDTSASSKGALSRNNPNVLEEFPPLGGEG